MNKKLKWSLIIFASLVVILGGLFKYFQYNIKKASPESTVEYKKNGKDITIFYNRPSKRGRVIFGQLVPYGKVWRTGANEATTFTTTTPLEVGDKKLEAGKYTMWTIPGENEWTVIINSGQYGWGVNFDTEASREADKDVLQVKVPVEKLEAPAEMFTIAFEDASTLQMVLTWDNVRVVIPVK
jgi:hypothetical protein